MRGMEYQSTTSVSSGNLSWGCGTRQSQLHNIKWEMGWKDKSRSYKLYGKQDSKLIVQVRFQRCSSKGTEDIVYLSCISSLKSVQKKYDVIIVPVTNRILCVCCNHVSPRVMIPKHCDQTQIV